MRWAHEHPERYAEIAALPLNEQNAALREAIAYDPDAIRDRLEEDRVHCHRPLTSSGSPDSTEEPPAGAVTPASRASAGFPSRRRTGMSCDCCGAPEDGPCQPFCKGEQIS